MPDNNRQVHVISLFSHKDGNYRHVFVNTDLKTRQLRAVVEDMLASTIRRGHYSVDVFGNKFTIDDLLRPEAVDDWRNCKSIESYKERLFKRDTYDFDLDVVPLKHFLNVNTYIFEDYVGNSEESLQKAVANKIAQSPEILQAGDEGRSPAAEAVGEVAAAIIEQLEPEPELFGTTAE